MCSYIQQNDILIYLKYIFSWAQTLGYFVHYETEKPSINLENDRDKEREQSISRKEAIKYSF